jgi:predicted transposase YdaD
MAFYFPDAHKQIDWQQPIEFLDTELAQIAPDAITGSRRADALVRVSRLEGQPKLVLIHIEVQSRHSNNFAERIFVYNYRIFNQHRLPVASLTILADTKYGHARSHYGYKVFGCEIRFKFPAITLRDYDLDKLLKDQNPFALLTAAHIQTQRTRHKHAERHAAKLYLIALLYKRGWPQERTMDFVSVIGWMMRLPAEMEASFWQEIQQTHKEFAMEYMLPFAREAREKGRAEGRQLGQAQLIGLQLTRRFGELPGPIHQLLQEADTEQLAIWAGALLDATSLDDVFAPAQRA